MAKQKPPKPDGWVGSGSSEYLFQNNLTGRLSLKDDTDTDLPIDRRNVSCITDYEGTDA